MGGEETRVSPAEERILCHTPVSPAEEKILCHMAALALAIYTQGYMDLRSSIGEDPLAIFVKG